MLRPCLEVFENGVQFRCFVLTDPIGNHRDGTENFLRLVEVVVLPQGFVQNPVSISPILKLAEGPGVLAGHLNSLVLAKSILEFLLQVRYGCFPRKLLLTDYVFVTDTFRFQVLLPKVLRDAGHLNSSSICC